MKLKTKFSRKSYKGGMTLIEILAVMTVIAILAGVMAYPIIGMIEKARMDAEEKILSNMKDIIVSSFQSEDLENLNISAIPSDCDDVLAANQTMFDFSQFGGGSGNMLNEAVIAGNEWMARFGRMQGLPVSSEGLRSVWQNAYKQRRILIVGPKEDSLQRYMILSFMVPRDRGLVIPGPPSHSVSDYKAWFDSIYNHNWESATGGPSGWGSAWAGTLRGRSYAARVKVARIVQPRYRLTLNLSIATGANDGVYIYFNKHNANTVGGTSENFSHEGESEVFTVPNTSAPGILAGRRVIVRRDRTPRYTAAQVGTVVNTVTVKAEDVGKPQAGFTPSPTSASNTKILEIRMNENSTITIQDN